MSLTCIFVSLLGSLNHLLVLALAVVREPAGDLFRRQARLVREHGLVDLLDVRMINMIQEPFLEYLSLLLRKSETLRRRVLRSLLLSYRLLGIVGVPRLVLRGGRPRLATLSQHLAGEHRFWRRRYAFLL